MARLKQLPRTDWYVDPDKVSGIQKINHERCRVLVDGHEVLMTAPQNPDTGQRDATRLFNELMDFAEGHPK